MTDVHYLTVDFALPEKFEGDWRNDPLFEEFRKFMQYLEERGFTVYGAAAGTFPSEE